MLNGENVFPLPEIRGPGRAQRRGRIKAIESIRGELVVVFAGKLRRGVSERRSAYSGVIIELDVFGMAIDEADVINSIVVRNVLIAREALVPGVAPMDRPLSHHDGA